MSYKFEWPSDVKKTKTRLSIVDVLGNTKHPISAQEIFDEVEASGESIWLSTIYRTLELFESKGLVTRIALANSDQALYEFKQEKHRHYAFCIRCQRVIEMKNCPMHNFKPQISDEGFQVMGHNLEVFGYCSECMKLQ